VGQIDQPEIEAFSANTGAEHQDFHVQVLLQMIIG
jgi:hypothetical protein